MVNNDDLIEKLQEKIEAKKKSIEKAKRFEPKTNCSLEFNSQRYNIHTLGKESLELLICQLASLQREANEFNLKLTLSGYKISEWLVDLQAKLNHLNISEEQGKLKVLENRLADLMSPDAKIQRELANIQKMLGDEAE